jgi:thiol-disulfide isomerase/thioredoxin
MLSKKLLIPLILSLFTLFTAPASAEQAALNAFTSTSYRQILAKYAGQPFVLVIWSITCPACLKDMPLLSALHKSWPALKMVMLATDELGASSDQVQAVLSKYGLAGLENWVFAEDNTQKLNYEIDPSWYGELPRTYFFDSAHVRQGISGVLSKAEYEAQFAKILNSPAPAP